MEGGLVAVGSCNEVRLMRGDDLTLVHGGLHRDDGGIVRSEGGSNGQTEPRIVYEIYKQNNTVLTTSISIRSRGVVKKFFITRLLERIHIRA